MTLADRLAKHREIAEAAIRRNDFWFSKNLPAISVAARENVGFIAANSPEVVLAFIALAEADDPEPQRDQADAYDKWLIRQELRANIDRVLGGGEG